MCLAYPARVLATVDGMATVNVRGRTQNIVLLALDGDAAPAAGDWLLVQSGIALTRLDPHEAASWNHLLDLEEKAS